ncbi:MAG TPA: endonuclease III [Bacilli bacterium]|nr:MAG: Ultraviolet N-glycosylase/AP lyase [Tenericutes bacterium ADurb.Bin140]HON64563.1 endonuclease III [Bacilli bacterium]HOR96718.1 endonuclease III [Bacilli bacterium]HPD12182.1 endonuclease III [Bacilli bacterium]HPK59152.1 endonuclease III [Bacilli bacterium]
MIRYMLREDSYQYKPVKHDEAFWQLLRETFPNARCELNYRNIYELAISVILSAQSTDKAVNEVTPALFKKYPRIEALAEATEEKVIPYIKKLGLYKNKANHIIQFAKTVQADFDGVIPSTIEELILLPGVGRKTANVIVSEGFGLPGLAVDTHVERVSKRLGLVSPTDNSYQVELKLKRLLPPEKWHEVHHQLIFMGRYLCLARKPRCSLCPFREEYCQMIHHKK